MPNTIISFFCYLDFLNSTIEGSKKIFMLNKIKTWGWIIVLIFGVIFMISLIDSTSTFFDNIIQEFINSFFEEGKFVYKYEFLSTSLVVSLLAYTGNITNKLSYTEDPLSYEIQSDFTLFKIGLLAGILNFTYIGYEIYEFKSINKPEIGLIVLSFIFLSLFSIHCLKLVRSKHYFLKISDNEIIYYLNGCENQINIIDINDLKENDKNISISKKNYDSDYINYEDYNLSKTEIESLIKIVHILKKNRNEMDSNEIQEDILITNSNSSTIKIFDQYVSKTKYGFKSNKMKISFDLDSGDFDVDFDICCFILNVEDKLINEECFVFYNNLISPNDFVENISDKITGLVDEQYFINFNNTLLDCQSILFYFVIHTEDIFPLTELKIKIENQSELSEYLEFSHPIPTNNENIIRLIKFEKDNDNWIMSSLFQNTNQNLEQIVTLYVNN